MNVVSIDPLADPRWERLQSAAGAGLFQSQPWFSVLKDTYGLPVSALIALDGAGEPLAGLACCALDDFLGRRLVALPFTDACDPHVLSREGWDAIARHLGEATTPVNLRFLNFSPPAASGLDVVKRARWHRLELGASLETLWEGIASASRRAIRKAERSAIEVRPFAGDEDLQQFHALHVGLRKRKYRLLAQPLAFFQAISRRFSAGGNWFPLGAFLDGRLIAGVIFLRWHDTLYYKFNASSEAGLDLRPNNLLIWNGIKLAGSLGCRWLDLGPSDDDQPGLVRFKRDFGAAESELSHLRLVPPGAVERDARSARRLLGEITALLTGTSVPDEVSAEAGAMLYRFFA